MLCLLSGSIYNGENINGKLFVRHSDQGQPIRLLSCSTGGVDDGFAQNLANKLGVDVLAPTDLLWVRPNGSFTIGPFDLINSGQLKLYAPKGNIGYRP